jgi:excisionase family DNA binding protein
MQTTELVCVLETALRSEVTMSEPITNRASLGPSELLAGSRSRMSVQEIAKRLDIGRVAVYAMLEQGILPGIRLGRRWIITRHAYEQWERTCGTGKAAGLHTRREVTVLN